MAGSSIYFANSPEGARTFMWARSLVGPPGAMVDGWNGPLEQVDSFRFQIPRSYKPQMRTSGLIFVDQPMIPQLRQDRAPEQVANVATMPRTGGMAMRATDGVAWSVEKGYAWPEDVDHIEAEGHLPDADFSRVGDRAIARGKDQVGSLGAGNHFVEIQKVDRVYDARAAKAFGID